MAVSEGEKNGIYNLCSYLLDNILRIMNDSSLEVSIVSQSEVFVEVAGMFHRRLFSCM